MECDRRMKKIAIKFFSALVMIIFFALTGCNTEQLGSTAETFTVTWLNYDGTILEIDNNVQYGEKPTYDGDSPIRESSEDYNYIFSGWSPEISEVISDITYVAQFKTTSAYTFKVTWLNYDGTVLEIDDAPFGSMPSYDGDTPIKPSDTFYEYAFKGWTPDLDTVLRDAIYTAQYTSTYKYDYLNFYFDIKEDENLNKYIEVKEATSFGSWDPVDLVIPPYVNVDGENLPVKSIGSNAFNGNPQGIPVGTSLLLNSISIPDTITHISYHAFSYYSKDYGNYNTLTSIFIPKSVTSIDEYAFYDCNGFSIYCEITKKLEGWASDWSGHTSIVWGYTGIDGITQDGIRYAVSQNDNGDKSIIITGCESSNTNLIIPSSISINGEDIPVKAIADNAFYKCDSLTSIYIPNSVTTVGSYAFHGCSSLTIYCEASSEPSGWDYRWNYYSNRPVVWNCTYDEYLETIA